MKTTKWLKLGMLLAAGAVALNGCLGDFWAGFFNTGWPADNMWLNLTVDILNEELFG